MTSYEIVKKAIEFDNPPRLPHAVDSFGVSDIHIIGWNDIRIWDLTKKKTYDEWNCIWERTDVPNMGQVTGHPLKDWKDLKTYKWLDPDDPVFYEGMEDQFSGSKGKYILSMMIMLLFERMHALRGFSGVMEDLYLERKKR